MGWFYTCIVVYNRAFFGAAKLASIWMVFHKCLSKQHASGNAVAYDVCFGVLIDSLKCNGIE